MTGITALKSALRGCGPYVLIELLVPGGSVLAVLLYLLKRRQAKSAALNP